MDARMQKVALVILTTAALWGAACRGGNGIPGGPVTAPTPTGSTAPPTVNLTGTENVAWDGPVSFDQPTGSYGMQLHLTQSGAQVSGLVNLFGPTSGVNAGGAGPFVGTLSGNTLNFNFSIGNQSQGCGNTVSGSASVATSTMTGTFNGKRCDTTPYVNAKFTLSLPTGFRTSPFPVGGKWTANNSVALGGSGVWTFDILETSVDLNGSNVTGSVAVANSSLNLGSGSLTGSVTNTFPGPSTMARMTVTFAGACPSNVVFNVGFPAGNPDFDGQRMTGNVSGTTCRGSLPGQGLNLFRQ